MLGPYNGDNVKVRIRIFSSSSSRILLLILFLKEVKAVFSLYHVRVWPGYCIPTHNSPSLNISV